MNVMRKNRTINCILLVIILPLSSIVGLPKLAAGADYDIFADSVLYIPYSPTKLYLGFSVKYSTSTSVTFSYSRPGTCNGYAEYFHYYLKSKTGNEAFMGSIYVSGSSGLSRVHTINLGYLSGNNWYAVGVCFTQYGWPQNGANKWTLGNVVLSAGSVHIRPESVHIVQGGGPSSNRLVDMQIRDSNNNPSHDWEHVDVIFEGIGRTEIQNWLDNKGFKDNWWRDLVRDPEGHKLDKRTFDVKDSRYWKVAVGAWNDWDGEYAESSLSMTTEDWWDWWNYYECKYRIRLWDLEVLDGTKYVLGGLHWNKLKNGDHIKSGYVDNCETMLFYMLYSRLGETHYGYRLVEVTTNCHMWEQIGSSPFDGEEESDGRGVYARFV